MTAWPFPNQGVDLIQKKPSDKDCILLSTIWLIWCFWTQMCFPVRADANVTILWSSIWMVLSLCSVLVQDHKLQSTGQLPPHYWNHCPQFPLIQHVYFLLLQITTTTACRCTVGYQGCPSWSLKGANAQATKKSLHPKYCTSADYRKLSIKSVQTHYSSDCKGIQFTSGFYARVCNYIE